MAWERTGTPGRRRAELRGDWERRRPRILRRDHHRCQWGLAQEGPEKGYPLGLCPTKATHVDHFGDRDDHRDEALRSLCAHHHQLRTSWQGGVASQAAKRDRDAQRNRPEETHPGIGYQART